MRKIIFVLLTTLLTLSCARKEKNEEGGTTTGKGERIEIAPLVINAVVLRDTNQMKNIFAAADSGHIRMYDYEGNFGLTAKFLNTQQFGQIKLGIQSLVQDPGSRVYEDWNSKPFSKAQVRDRIIMCDTVLESSFDADGNEHLTRYWACDSTSRYNQINRILFYESMFYNKDNNMIERDVLGYSLQRYVESKDAYKTVFMVFKDEKAVEKVKSNYKDL